LVGWDLEWKPDNTMKLKGSHQQMAKRVDSIFFNDLEKTSRHLVFLTHDQYLQDDDSVKELICSFPVCRTAIVLNSEKFLIILRLMIF
jgi:hypothetical protein